MTTGALVRFAFVSVVLTACGTPLEDLRPDPSPVARLAAPANVQVIIPPSPNRSPTPVGREAFLDFMRWTLPHIPETEEEIRIRMLENWQAVLPKPQRSFHLLQASFDPDPLLQGYDAWCAERRLAHDCSGALQGKPHLDALGRYRIAFDIALGAEWVGFINEMRGIVDPTQVKVMLLGAMVLYMVTLAVPELVTKFVAAAITMVLTAYLGAQTVWELVFGWIEMARAADRATTFGELMNAGRRYGERVGAQVARILIMVVTAAIAEGGLVARVLKLPNAPLASRALAQESGGTGSFAAVGQVWGASVSASGVTVVLQPAAEGAAAVGVAMAARGTGATGSQPTDPCDKKPEWHHVATVENSKSALRGGPWTPRFQLLFDKAGLSMENAANQVLVKGHRGPHPEAYHQDVYKKLQGAVAKCTSTAACRQGLEATLKKLSQDIATPGTELNKLVTRGCE